MMTSITSSVNTLQLETLGKELELESDNTSWFKELQEQLIHLQEQLQQAQQERDEKEVCQRFCGSSCAITCLFAKVS
jgi:hypothetical protein